MKKVLYKSDTHKVIFGVIGGVGEYFDIDESLARLIWILITAFTGFIPGIIAYVISAAVIPNKIRK